MELRPRAPHPLLRLMRERPEGATRGRGAGGPALPRSKIL